MNLFLENSSKNFWSFSRSRGNWKNLKKWIFLVFKAQLTVSWERFQMNLSLLIAWLEAIVMGSFNLWNIFLLYFGVIVGTVFDDFWHILCLRLLFLFFIDFLVLFNGILIDLLLIFKSFLSITTLRCFQFFENSTKLYTIEQKGFVSFLKLFIAALLRTWVVFGGRLCSGKDCKNKLSRNLNFSLNFS